MKSLLLINPPNSDQIRSPGYYLLPLSLLYLAGSSRDVANVTILDLNVSKSTFFRSKKEEHFSYTRAVQEEMRRLMPDFVGITCLFSAQFEMILSIAEAVKFANPSAVVILGGMHPTIFHKEIVSNCPTVDAVVIGEGELTLKKMLSYDKDDWHGIEGLAFKNRSGQITINEKKDFIDNLDELAPAAYDLFNFEDYKLDSSGWYNPKKFTIGTSAPVLTSRSCPFKCSFCGMNLVMGSSFPGAERGGRLQGDGIPVYHPQCQIL